MVFSYLLLKPLAKYTGLQAGKTNRAPLNFLKSLLGLWMKPSSSYFKLECWPCPTSLLRSRTICRQHKEPWKNVMEGSLKKSRSQQFPKCSKAIIPIQQKFNYTTAKPWYLMQNQQSELWDMSTGISFPQRTSQPFLLRPVTWASAVSRTDPRFCLNG